MGMIDDITQSIEENTLALRENTKRLGRFNEGLSDAEENLLKRLEKRILDDVKILARKVNNETRKL